MGTDFFKSAIDSLDKVTDILNVGRLIFYTAAGFCALLPAVMMVHMLVHPPADYFWNQFVSDAGACAAHAAVWVAALVFGFIIADVVNATVMAEFTPPARHDFAKDTYSYSYARLFSGGVRPKEGATSKDYAAWLVSEYYRYVEIAVFIPYAILLSLPLYSLYSLIYLIRTSGRSEPLVVNGAHIAFALWSLGAAVVWMVVWPDYWVRRIAEPLYRGWVDARRSAIAGLQDFLKDPSPSPHQDNPQTSAEQQ